MSVSEEKNLLPTRLTDLFSFISPGDNNLPFARQWRRIMAFLLDGVLISLISALLIVCCFNLLAELGEWGRGIGFAVALCYFTIGNSHFTAGQTLGKRLFGIRVVNFSGQPVSLWCSFLRALVPSWLLAMRDITISAGFAIDILITIINLICYLLLLFELYLFVFDCPARRTLHDMMAGSVVLKSDAEVPPQPIPTSLAKFHQIVLALGVVILSAIAVNTIYHARPVFSEKEIVQENLRKINGVYSATVTRIEPQNGRPAMLLVAIATNKELNEERRRELFPQMARVMINYFPDLNKHSHILLSARYGVHMGIANWAPPVNYLRSPAQLRAIANFEQDE